MITRNGGRMLAFGLVAFATSARAAEFRGLGDLTSPLIESAAYAVSADGGVVVGRGTAVGAEATRWNGSNLTGLGDLDGGPRESYAYGVSGDGQVIVGASASGTQGPEAFRWTPGGGLHGLGYLSTYRHSEALGVSPDGASVVGYALMPGAVSRPFHWRDSTGMVALPDLAGGAEGARASGISGNNVIVGQSWGVFGLEAVRWIDGVAVGLGDLEGGGFQSSATAIAPNGSGVVGYSWSARGFEAFLWRPGDLFDIRNPNDPGGMIALGDLEGGAFDSLALGVSDGGWVVGRGTTADGHEAFLWTPNEGMRRLADVLTAQGASLHGWTLTSATAISRDGRTIVGYGWNPQGRREAWAADFGAVPEPASLAALSLGLLALRRRRR